MAYQVLKEQQKISAEYIDDINTKKNSTLERLILKELMDFFVPITHGICIGMAYFRPNANFRTLWVPFMH